MGAESGLVKRSSSIPHWRPELGVDPSFTSGSHVYAHDLAGAAAA